MSLCRSVATLIGTGLVLAGCVVAPVARPVAAPPPIPPPVVEAIPAPPGSAYMWVTGHWAWRDHRRGYVWVPGYYALPVQPGYVWVPGYWSPSPRGYLWIESHWRLR